MLRRALYLTTVILLILMAIYSLCIDKYISIYSAFQDGINDLNSLEGEF